VFQQELLGRLARVCGGIALGRAAPELGRTAIRLDAAKTELVVVAEDALRSGGVAEYRLARQPVGIDSLALEQRAVAAGGPFQNAPRRIFALHDALVVAVEQCGAAGSRRCY